MIRIFHTGDLHLDSAFCRFSHTEQERARERQRRVFRKMMRYVGEHRYDLLLISGDLFDKGNVSPETEECVIAELSALPCPTVIAPGNHDPYTAVSLYSDGRLPEKVTVFNSSEMQVLSLDTPPVQVCGYAFMSESLSPSPLIGFEPPAFDGISLLCAHTELGALSSGYAPATLTDIERCGFDYAALGHVHNCPDVFRLGKSTAAYCGFADSRGFDEEGSGGALSVTVDDDGNISVEKLCFGESVYAHDTLDISNISNNSELVRRVEEYLSSYENKENTALKLSLVGETEPEFEPDMISVRELLSKSFVYSEAENKTLPRIDTEDLELDYTLRGEVFRVLRSELDSNDKETAELAAEALKAALRAIEGRSI